MELKKRMFQMAEAVCKKHNLHLIEVVSSHLLGNFTSWNPRLDHTSL